MNYLKPLRRNGLNHFDETDIKLTLTDMKRTFFSAMSVMSV